MSNEDPAGAFIATYTFRALLAMRVTLVVQPSMAAKSTTFDRRCACAILGADRSHLQLYFLLFLFYFINYCGLHLAMSYFGACLSVRYLASTVLGVGPDLGGCNSFTNLLGLAG